MTSTIDQEVEKIIHESLRKFSSKNIPENGDLLGPNKVLDSILLISFLDELETRINRKWGHPIDLFQDTESEQGQKSLTNIYLLKALICSRLKV